MNFIRTSAQDECNKSTQNKHAALVYIRQKKSIILGLQINFGIRRNKPCLGKKNANAWKSLYPTAQ